MHGRPAREVIELLTSSPWYAVEESLVVATTLKGVNTEPLRILRPRRELRAMGSLAGVVIFVRIDVLPRAPLIYVREDYGLV